MANRHEARRETIESRTLVETAFELARSLDITALLVQADELQDVRLIEKLRQSEKVVWLTHSTDFQGAKESADLVISLPETTLTRISQMKIGLLLAALNEQIELDASVVCLSGVAGSKRLDTLLIANPRRDFPWFRHHHPEKASGAIATRELARVLEVSLRLAAEGREGRPIGTIFVLGDPEQLAPHLRQLVLNPCEGHRKKDRSIHESHFFETLREFAALDGAFVVNRRGVVESAGTYLAAPATKRTKLFSGLGARHASAAAITAETDATAVVVSASSGTVTVFHEGRSILELEKPVPQPMQSEAGRRRHARNQ